MMIAFAKLLIAFLSTWMAYAFISSSVQRALKSVQRSGVSAGLNLIEGSFLMLPEHRTMIIKPAGHICASRIMRANRICGPLP